MIVLLGVRFTDGMNYVIVLLGVIYTGGVGNFTVLTVIKCDKHKRYGLGDLGRISDVSIITCDIYMQCG